jgi:RNA polymerase sigma-70 factor (ECF subfamily)
MSFRLLIDPAEFADRLADARAGSCEALGRLWLECRNYLLLVANKNLDPALAAKMNPSDLVQETFLDAQRDFAQFGGTREDELRAWLCRILTNNIANATRQFRGTSMRDVDREIPLAADSDAARPAQDLLSDTPTPSQKAVAREEETALQQALARLPDHYRQVLRLRYDDDMTFAAIGAVMGCSEEAARKLWARALDSVAKEMLPHDEP